MHLPEIVTSASVIFALASAGWAGLRQGAVKDLRETNKDLRDEIADKDRREAEAKRLQEAADQKIQALQVDLAALAKVVTGETHMVAINEQLDTIGRSLVEVQTAVSEIHSVLIPEDR